MQITPTQLKKCKDRVAIYYHWLNLCNKTANIKQTELHPFSQVSLENSKDENFGKVRYNESHRSRIRILRIFFILKI